MGTDVLLPLNGNTVSVSAIIPFAMFGTFMLGLVVGITLGLLAKRRKVIELNEVLLEQELIISRQQGAIKEYVDALNFVGEKTGMVTVFGAKDGNLQ